MTNSGRFAIVDLFAELAFLSIPFLRSGVTLTLAPGSKKFKAGSLTFTDANAVRGREMQEHKLRPAGDG